MNFNKAVVITTITMVLAAGNAFTQVKRKPAPSPKQKQTAAKEQMRGNILPVDPEVLTGKLTNGLTYYIRHNEQPKNRAELYLVNKAGSILETDQQQGLAHFIEHMAFNGTRDFPKNQLVDFLQRSGVKFGSDLNAYTSFDETVYQLPVPTDSAAVFEKGFNILANWAGYVTFDPAELSKERGVILEEERLRGKNAQERLSLQTLPVLLNNSRYASRLPIGKEDIIKNADAIALKTFYHDWYRPDLQAVIAVGDFDVKRVEQLIKVNFASLKNPAGEKPLPAYAVAPTPGTVIKTAIDKEFPYTLAQIIVKHPQIVVKTPAAYLESIRISLFNFMLNERIKEILQKPEPPFLYARASYAPLAGKQDAFSAVVVAKPGKLEPALKAIIAETERARKFGFALTELERAKQAALIQIQNMYNERDKTNSSNFVAEYRQNFLSGAAIPGIAYGYNFYANNISKINLSEMNALAAKFITNQNRVVIVESAEKDKDKLPAEKTILDWVNTSGSTVTAYVDNATTRPLMDKMPEGSKIISDTTDEAIGTTLLKLANGVKVILKPTQFKNDQILINCYSLGGSSLASDRDFTSANLAAPIISSSGVADFNQGQLDKILNGKNVSVSPYISDITQGVSASTTPRDFETTMQLIYLYFTQPRKDADVWKANISQTKALLTNRGLDPGGVYQDTVSAVTNNHNFRAMATTLERLNDASLDKAFDFYKERFADASGFTFTFVGNFNVEQLKPFIETYLGALPSKNRKESFKDLGMHPPAGQITKVVYKGVEDKATVQMVFSGPYEFNAINNLQLDALEEILNIKLTERLREQESSVYSPGVRATYVKLPSARYVITIYFSCAAANTDKLIAATIDEIGKIKQTGAQPADIQKFVAEEARSTQVQLKENIFWAGYLASAAQNDQNPDDILSHVSSLEKITVQSTKDAASKYLNNNNLIKLILMPEKK